jgi:DNA-binding response OmpR family regulator
MTIQLHPEARSVGGARYQKNRHRATRSQHRLASFLTHQRFPPSAIAVLVNRSRTWVVENMAEERVRAWVATTPMPEVRKPLTVSEATLWARLARDAGQPVSHTALVQALGGATYEGWADPYTCRTHIWNLRRKGWPVRSAGHGAGYVVPASAKGVPWRS